MNETQVSQLPVYAGNDLGAVWRSLSLIHI